MELLSKLKQYYRYRRNWKKFQSRRAKGGIYKNASQQLEFYSQFISKGDLVFDVGANVGDKTEIFVQLGATVVAVEPQESCWRVLKHRFKNKDVYVMNKALDKSVGNKRIFIDRSPTISSMSPEWIESVRNSGRFARHRWSYKLKVETTTLDALIKQFGNPAFCKIDVEGFEFEVLQGLSQPIRAMSFEFIPEYLEPVLGCIDYLSKLGNVEFNFSLGDSMDFAMSCWSNVEKIVNVLQSLSADSQGDVYARFCEG